MMFWSPGYYCISADFDNSLSISYRGHEGCDRSRQYGKISTEKRSEVSLAIPQGSEAEAWLEELRL